MNNKRIKSLTCFSTIIFLILVSCKKEKKIVERSDNYKISFVFPDTVFINELYNGKINYKNSLDTITTSFDDIKKNRYIYYSYIKNKSINYDDSLKKIIRDTFGARNNKLIPLYNIKFDKLGLNYIDGFITDEVMIDNGAKNAKGESMTRIITNEFRVTKKVFVIKNRTKK
ncbi:hypothetical protein RC62_1214 [Flavobacterium aquidurense]|uniref:Lipoprotein n=1 Tax=Flavobacterium aquidurense TaxID=362413 RepID=A0A0N8VMJ9_9FLAO|nr:hypothetical protein RC62_1214 [Flavobacterium aquidurense]